MGLDMYFNKHTYVQNWEHNGPEGQFKITVKKGGKNYPNGIGENSMRFISGLY